MVYKSKTQASELCMSVISEGDSGHWGILTQKTNSYIVLWFGHDGKTE